MDPVQPITEIAEKMKETIRGYTDMDAALQDMTDMMEASTVVTMQMAKAFQPIPVSVRQMLLQQAGTDAEEVLIILFTMSILVKIMKGRNNLITDDMGLFRDQLCSIVDAMVAESRKNAEQIRKKEAPEMGG